MPHSPRSPNRQAFCLQPSSESLAGHKSLGNKPRLALATEPALSPKEAWPSPDTDGSPSPKTGRNYILPPSELYKVCQRPSDNNSLLSTIEETSPPPTPKSRSPTYPPRRSVPVSPMRRANSARTNTQTRVHKVSKAPNGRPKSWTPGTNIPPAIVVSGPASPPGPVRRSIISPSPASTVASTTASLRDIIFELDDAVQIMPLEGRNQNSDLVRLVEAAVRHLGDETRRQNNKRLSLESERIPSFV